MGLKKCYCKDTNLNKIKIDKVVIIQNVPFHMYKVQNSRSTFVCGATHCELLTSISNRGLWPLGGLQSTGGLPDKCDRILAFTIHILSIV